MTYVVLIVLAVGLLAAAGYKTFRYLKALIARPILEIHLTPVDEPRWKDHAQVPVLISTLEAKGFLSAGYYECPEMPSLIIAGFVHPVEQMAGSIYEHTDAGIWTDISVFYDDGGSLTVSNAPKGQEMDQMPGQEKIYMKDSSADQLFDKARAMAKATGRAALSREEFARHFESHYRKEMKWRLDRGGPTYLEVRKVADRMGTRTDMERIQKESKNIQTAWREEGRKEPQRIVTKMPSADLPATFQRPDDFRRTMEQKSEPAPVMAMPALPVYLLLIGALAYWSYFGYSYSRAHFPVPMSSLIVFFAVLVLLVVMTLFFRSLHRNAQMHPVLKRIAAVRPGAFVIVSGRTPVFFYAQEAWLGKVSFLEGGKGENASTRLNFVMNGPRGQIALYRKGLPAKLIRSDESDVVKLPESDFSREFELWSTEAGVAERFLEPSVVNAVAQIAEIGNPVLDVDGSAGYVEVSKDLSGPRKEAALARFLAAVETIVNAVSQADPARHPGAVRHDHPDP